MTVNGVPGFISYFGDVDTMSITGGNDVVLYGFTPVPEPGAVLAVAAGALAVAGGLRRRLWHRSQKTGGQEPANSGHAV